ncbi:MAG: glutamate--tRNA ligase [Clostridium sp.]|jgi:glutamyl-tRNA synthetase|nr:glutamate--tRNA ligase [Clostridium sp.]
MSTIKSRYAPSPTGQMHVGNLRSALYEYLIAKHENGKFMLRIEDTDQERFVPGALETIYSTMQTMGLTHDEGPDKDGGVGPYVQSERMKTGIYLRYAKELIDKGEAYYCFCDKERLESLKTSVVEGKEIMVYDKHCLHLSQAEIASKLADGTPYVIRQNNPDTGTTTFHDELYGDITVENKELDDMILIKSDGYPTYNFANVVDDHTMGITHVVRGNEYLSSSPKYVRLYQAFGWESPIYVHLPLITDEFHKKLSKRSGHFSVMDLLAQGFLKEAVVNYIALLGWSPTENREIFSLAELIEQFDYRRISKSPAVFDIVKLRWMNGEYLKAMEEDRFYLYISETLTQALTAADGTCRFSDHTKRLIARMVKTRIETPYDIPEQVDFLVALPDYDLSLFTHKKMKTDSASSYEVLSEVYPALEQQTDYTNAALYDRLSQYIADKGYKNGYVMWPIRTALSGKQTTPAGATEILELLRKEESLRRIQIAIDRLREVIN